VLAGQRQLAEVPLQAEAVGPVLDPGPAPVGLERPRVGLVAQGGVEDGGQSFLDSRIADGQHRLDAPVEVPFHQVGGAQCDASPPAVHPAEQEDPGVLQVPPDDRPDPDALRQAGDTGPETATAPDQQVDAHASP